MDFGVVSHKQTSLNNASSLGSNEPRDEKDHGSENLKHQRSGLSDQDSNSWSLSKMTRLVEVDFSSKKASENFSTPPPFVRSNLWASSVEDDVDGQKMLSFSSEEPHCGRSIAFSICQDDEHHRNRTQGGGGIRGGALARVLKGPFTPSQWMDLEHQALIYKHIVANVPVPSSLLVPLKRSLYSPVSSSSYASNLLGWAPFHLGFSGGGSNNNDPEPGRCRRTDGKKWRCSRDAVPDQKYCERHINRGRHRSRKPVEGHTTGHASNSKVPPPPPPPPINVSSSSSLSMSTSSNASNTFSAMQRQFSSLHHPNSATASTTTDHLVSRSQGFQGPPTTGLKPPKDTPLSSVQKQHATIFEESSNSEFGIVSSDSLLNPTSGRISYMNNTNSNSFLQFDGAKEAHPVHHFIDDWPKDQSHRATSGGPWPEEMKSDWTQLSMSIPMAPDFSCSSNTPTAQAKPISTLRLSSHDLDPIHMGLGVSPIQKQPSWLPVTWGNPMGGPLGEVLSSQIGSSPTGVLQKSTFVSLSNSSSGSSPTSGDNNKKASENVSLCNDLLGSALAAIPSL